MNDGPEEPAKRRTGASRGVRAFGIIALVAVALGFLVFPLSSAVATLLEEDGFTAVIIERHGPFSFSYEAKKGGDNCWGAVTKMPGTERITRVCVNPQPTE